MSYHCDHCHQDKPIEDFYSYAKRKCKQCFKDYRIKYEATHRDIIRAKSNRMYHKHREARILKGLYGNGAKKDQADQVNAEWIKNNREKRNASANLRYAVAMGRVVKPDACEICNRRRSLQGHHRDYSKPLEVQWLCVSCHRLIHSKYGHPMLEKEKGQGSPLTQIGSLDRTRLTENIVSSV
jgi:hypothetical protein